MPPWEIVVAAVAALVAVWTTWREIRAFRRERRLRLAAEVITKPLPAPAWGGDVVLGAGAVAATLYELYAVADAHREVLADLQGRFHELVPVHANPLQWFGFFEAEHPGVPVVEGFHEAGDVAHHVPVVGLAVFGVRTYTNLRRWAQGRATRHETGAEVVGDAARVGVGVLTGMGGAKVGALLGSLVSPGVGTVIGGGIGAIVAGIGGSRLVARAKEEWKYGQIKAAVRTIGRLVHAELDGPRVAQCIADGVFGRPSLFHDLAEEEALAARYEAETRLYSRRWAPPTMMGALARRHRDELRGALWQTDAAARAVPDRLRRFVPTHEGQPEFGFLGELAAANADVFEPLLAPASADLARYADQIDRYPHHPLRFRDGAGEVLASRDVLRAVCAEELARVRSPVRHVPATVPGRRLNRALLALSSVAAVAALAAA